MSVEPELTTVNIEIDKTNELRWIIGNLFFTSMIICIALIQMYIYYHNNIKVKNICFAIFFIILVGLLIATRNIPLSLLCAIIVSNLIVTCGNLDVFDKKENEEQMNKIEKKLENVDKNIEKITKKVDGKKVDGKKVDGEKVDGEEEPVSELPSRKSKEKYVSGSNFESYLTNDNNDLAYPEPPLAMKFTN